MILHQVKCEICPKSVEIGTLVNFWDVPLSQEWFTVFMGAMRPEPKAMHFCSTPCLKTWLANQSLKKGERLSQEHKNLLDQQRRRLNGYCIDLTKVFEQEHPELKLSWGFTLDALPREEPS